MDESILTNALELWKLAFLVVMMILTLEVIPIYYKILNVGAFRGRESL